MILNACDRSISTPARIHSHPLPVQAASNKKQLQEIESTILKVLSDSQGNILEDATAVDALTMSKQLSIEINQKQQVAQETELKIDEARSGYQPIAFTSSVMYFCIADLSHIDPMYQYSLGWYINLFTRGIETSPPSEELPERLEFMQAHFMQMLYVNVCRSLFAKDKLLFSFLLCQRLMESRGEIDSEEWRFLLTGGIGGKPSSPNPAPVWLADTAWGEVTRLGELPHFKALKFTDRFKSDLDGWRYFWALA